MKKKITKKRFYFTATDKLVTAILDNNSNYSNFWYSMYVQGKNGTKFNWKYVLE